MTELDDLWAREAHPTVIVGDVVDATGRVLDVQRLLMRRWGWPKLASKRAAEWLELRFGGIEGDASGMVLPVAGPLRTELQQRLLTEIPELTENLMDGIAGRAHRDVRDAHRPISAVEVAFVKDSAIGRVSAPINDEGILTSMVNVVAGRLGISADELRDRCDFERQGTAVRLTVWVEDD